MGVRLRHTRENLQLSHELLADGASIHRTHIGQVERGERNVSVDKLEKLAGAEVSELVSPWLTLARTTLETRAAALGRL